MSSIKLACIYFTKELKDLTLFSLEMNLPFIFAINRLTAWFM